MKNLLTQSKTEEENQNIGGSVSPIDRTPNGGELFIDGTLIELKDDAECASLPKLTKLVKKPSNLTRTRKEKPHRPISHSLAHFVEPIGRPRFWFVENLTGGLTDSLAMGRVESRGEEVAIGFSG